VPERGPGLASPAVAAFWEKLARAKERILFLDYDGTLAPFRPERDQAVPYEGVRRHLDRIQRDRTTRLVVVSGRPAADLLPLLRLDQAPEIWGCHGIERLLPDGILSKTPLDEDQERGLRDAARWARENGFADRLEEKPACLAFHWRGLGFKRQQELGNAVHGAWSVVATRSNLQLQPFNGGLELRTGSRNKGTAVATVLDELGPDPAVAYLGDDFTDEDAFTTLGDRGLSVLVRQQWRPSGARVWIQPPGELLDFLLQWRQITADGPP